MIKIISVLCFMLVPGLSFSEKECDTCPTGKEAISCVEGDQSCDDEKSFFNSVIAKPLKKNIIDHRPFGKLLKAHVKDGRVDYKALHAKWRESDHPLKLYLRELAGPTKAEVQAWSRYDQMAFYINAYNAYTLMLILDYWPLKSIRNIEKKSGPFGIIKKNAWKIEFVNLWHEVHTLDWIEHEILRGVFKDPRIHAAVNCASISCPELLSVPFTGADLDDQLNDAMEAFINDRTRNEYNVKTKKAKLSKIFDWYGGDFKPSVKDYILKYADSEARKVLILPDVTIEFLEYDWTLNGPQE